MKTLVVYCYKEDNDTIINLSFFLKHGVIHNPDYYYVFIVNNMKCSVPIQESNQIRVYKRNENEYDLYSYKWFINHILATEHSFLYMFERYYFANSSCIGPFIPPIVELNWIEIMNKKLEAYDLIAPIVEFPPDSKGYNYIGINTSLNVPFLHSYMFGTNNQSIDILIDVLINARDPTQDNVIMLERILTSTFLLRNKKIYSFLLAFKNIDINDMSIWDYKLWNKSSKTCYEIPENYFGIDVNPFEVMFIKNIRKNHAYRASSISGISNIINSFLNNYTIWY